MCLLGVTTIAMSGPASGQPGAEQPASSELEPTGDRQAPLAQSGLTAQQKVTYTKRYARGEVLYEQGNYPAAVREFVAAYEIARFPEMLLNIAQVYRKANNKPLALRYYRRFLTALPNNSFEGEVRTRIHQLEAERAAERVAKIRASNAGLGMRMIGLSLGVASLVGFGAAIKFGLDAQRHERALAGFDQQWSPEAMAQLTAGERADRRLIVATTIGGASLVAGTVLYLWGLRTRTRARRGAEVVPVAAVICRRRREKPSALPCGNRIA